MFNAKFSLLIALLNHVLYQVVASFSFDPASAASYVNEDVIKTDVAVIEGGLAGVYAAVRLQDHNKSIVIVETNNYLGGHAEAYTDPQSGIPINLGVIAFSQTKTVHDYFSRFGIGLEPLSLSYSTGKFVDFSTSKIVGDIPPTAADTAAALQVYTAQLEKYPFVHQGSDLTYPVPDDLLLPFGTFLAKYNLTSLIFTSHLHRQRFSHPDKPRRQQLIDQDPGLPRFSRASEMLLQDRVRVVEIRLRNSNSLAMPENRLRVFAKFQRVSQNYSTLGAYVSARYSHALRTRNPVWQFLWLTRRETKAK